MTSLKCYCNSAMSTISTPIISNIYITCCCGEPELRGSIGRVAGVLFHEPYYHIRVEILCLISPKDGRTVLQILVRPTVLDPDLALTVRSRATPRKVKVEQENSDSSRISGRGDAARAVEFVTVGVWVGRRGDVPLGGGPSILLTDVLVAQCLVWIENINGPMQCLHTQKTKRYWYISSVVIVGTVDYQNDNFRWQKC